MYIYLTNHHEAMVFNDRRDTVTVSTELDGTLTVNGKNYPITHGGSCPAVESEGSCAVKAAFTTSDGICYTVIAPRAEKGAIMSRPDPYATILTQRILIDELEKGLETANERIRKLEGQMKPRALNFMFKNQKEE